jgi:hypothetical protein
LQERSSPGVGTRYLVKAGTICTGDYLARLLSVRHLRLLKFVGVAWLLAATPISQRIQAQGVATIADVELWTATLDQIQREKQPRALAVMNETLTAAEFRGRLENITSEPVLVDRLLRRNESAFRIRSNVKPSIELVDSSTVRQRGRAELDMQAVGARFGQRSRRLVRLSLPAYSDDGARALVFTWTAGGFDDASGGGYLFERKQGQWIVVGYLAAWIA